jgi:hypothetical protein
VEMELRIVTDGPDLKEIKTLFVSSAARAA